MARKQRPSLYVIHFLDPELERRELVRVHGEYDLADPANMEESAEGGETLAGAKSRARALERRGAGAIRITKRIGIHDETPDEIAALGETWWTWDEEIIIVDCFAEVK